MPVAIGTAPVRAASALALSAYVKKVWPVIFLCTLSSLLLLWRLGDRSLSDWDEAVYAQAAKEMVNGGDWLALHYEYKLWMDEPPLLVWLTAMFFQFFAVNEFWSRAVSAFSGIAAIIVTYIIGKFVYDKWVGILAGVILVTSFHFTRYSRAGMTDILLTLFTLLAIYAFLRLEEGRQKWWFVIGISSAFAIMVKSFSGLIAPAVITLELLLRKRLVATTRSRQFWVGLILALLIVAPWHIFMLLKYGRMFIDNYILFHIAHATATLQGNTGTRFFYVDQLQAGFYPWFYLVPVALAVNIQQNVTAPARSRILLLIVVLVLGMFTLAQTKLRWYILPLYPALAILTASMVMQAFHAPKSVSFAGLAVGTFVIALLAPRNVILAAAFVGLFVLLGSLLISKTISYRAIAGVMSAFFVLVATHNIVPLYRVEDAPVAKLARIAATTSPEDHEPLIVSSGLYRPRALFYSGRPIYEAQRPQDLEELAKNHQATRVILAKDDMFLFSKIYDIHVIAEAAPLVYGVIDLTSNRR